MIMAMVLVELVLDQMISFLTVLIRIGSIMVRITLFRGDCVVALGKEKF